MSHAALWSDDPHEREEAAKALGELAERIRERGGNL
jgi:hypothetical protein